MEDTNKLIYAEYKASIHMHGLMAHLARKYGLSRQRISAIIKSMEPSDSTELAKIKFWDNVLKGEPNECWPYLTKYKGPITGRQSRQAWTYINGEIPEGMEVLHTCDYPPCCNPAHLFLGTQSDNMKDKAAKGRYRVYDQAPHPSKEKFKKLDKRASLLTDRSIDLLVQLMALMPGSTIQEIIDRALTEYELELDRQSEYDAPVEARQWTDAGTPPDDIRDVEITVDGVGKFGYYDIETWAKWFVYIDHERINAIPVNHTGQTVTAWREIDPAAPSTDLVGD